MRKLRLRIIILDILIVLSMIAIGVLVCSCTITDACKIKYSEPDETWNYYPFNPEYVVETHSASSKAGGVYWCIYTDYTTWNSQVISMEKETYEILIEILYATDIDERTELIDIYEPYIYYKQHHQPVLILSDKD